MNFENALKSQYAYVKQAFQDFEALKRIWERQAGEFSNSFENYSDDDSSEKSMQMAESPFEHEEEQDSQWENQESVFDEEESDAPWNRYTSPYEATMEHAEFAPPRLMTDYSMIDADDPRFAGGMELGLPTYVSIRHPHAGNLMFYGFDPSKVYGGGR